MSSELPIYHNQKQLDFLTARQRIKTFIGGIGTGKTTVMGTESYMDVIELPHASQFFLGNTFAQVLNKTLPAVIKIWEKFGLQEGVHFVVGKTPPSHWQKPYEQPKNFENTISFPNGHVISILSLDRPQSNRGASYQCGKIDEAGLINEKPFKEIILGRLRGDVNLFRSHRFRSLSFFSSMPFLSYGTWILDYEVKAFSNPSKYFYMESTTYDNIQVLGMDYIKDLEEDMDYLTFQREVMNARNLQIPNAFYADLSDEVHLYSGFGYQFADNWKDTKVIDADTNPNLPLDISFDFGGQFDCCTVWQYIEGLNEHRCINNFHRKQPQILNDLVDKVCTYYSTHKEKKAYLWGDKSGSKVENNSRMNLFQQVQDRMSKRGWVVTIKYNGWDNPKHAIKHYVINKLLKEEDTKQPKIRINKDRCKDLILSMKNAGVNDDFKKDKSSEHNGTDRLRATDLSDSFDYYIFFKLNNKVSGRKIIAPGFG